MIYKLVRNDSDIDKLLSWCSDSQDSGTHYSGMSYEDGIRDVIDWLTGESDIGPHE